MPTQVINMRDKKAVDEAARAGLFVYVGRDRHSIGPWGNKYSHLSSNVPGVVRVDSRSEAVRRHAEDTEKDSWKVARIKAELRGKILGCWCAPQAYHADTYAEIADRPE